MNNNFLNLQGNKDFDKADPTTWPKENSLWVCECNDGSISQLYWCKNRYSGILAWHHNGFEITAGHVVRYCDRKVFTKG